MLIVNNIGNTMQLATKIFLRMTEMEKIQVRGASHGVLDHLAETSFRSDMPLQSFDERTAVMREVQSLCLLEFANKSQVKDFSGVTWRF